MPVEFELNPDEFQSKIIGIDFLYEGGISANIGLIIPDYQRNYTWEQQDVDRLFTDIMASLSTRTKKPASNFFGATVWCRRDREIEKEFMLPSYDVVDGQQRITSVTLLTMCLFLAIKKNNQELIEEGSLPSPLETWLKVQIDGIEGKAVCAVGGQLSRRTPQDFPRIIHEEDIRGSTSSTSDFTTPISRIQLAFLDAVNDRKLSIDFDNILTTISEKNHDVFNRMKENSSYFDEYLSKVMNKKFWDSLNIPFVEKSSLCNDHLKALFIHEGKKIPQSEFDSFLDASHLFEKQIRLFQFFGQLFKASCFSVITCNNEDTAFNIFDALNTTGVPLTAIETLKPFIMRTYRDSKQKFDGSAADKNLKIVDTYIRSPSNDKDNQIKLSKELVIHTVLLGRGKTVNNDLNTQRIEIRELQSKCTESEEKDLASQILKNTVEYRQKFSSVINIRAFYDSSLDSKENDEVQLINSFFSETKTQLVRPILTRFQWEEPNLKIYHKACKALAAFYVLRRATSTTTDRIDDIFRNCLGGTLAYTGLKLDCKSPGALRDADLEDFKSYLSGLLSTKELKFTINEKEKWVDHVKNMDLYSNAKTLLRFMLFASHDGANIDMSDQTLLQRYDAPINTSRMFLQFSAWDDKNNYETLEHVAPQSPLTTGYAGVYDDPKLKNTIGNFVLLPKGRNSALSDSPWHIKKLFLKVLLDDSLARRKKLISDEKAKGIELPASIAKAVLDKDKGLVKSHMLSGLENVADWDADFIKKRSERLCSLCWDRIHSWLE